MKVDGPAAAAVRHVAERMRDKDVDEFLAVSHVDTHAELVDTLVARYAAYPHAYVFADSEPVAVGALVFVRPNVATLAFFATDGFAALAPSIARFVTREIFPAYREHGTHRIECVSIDGYDEVHRWIEMLGLKREGVFPGYGRAGEAFHQFAWTSCASARKVAAAGTSRGTRAAAPSQYPIPAEEHCDGPV